MRGRTSRWLGSGVMSAATATLDSCLGGPPTAIGSCPELEEDPSDLRSLFSTLLLLLTGDGLLPIAELLSFC